MKEGIANMKSCKNCRYFSQHYSIQGTGYHTVGCGHCLNSENKKKRPYDLCDLWEDIAVRKEERKKSIEETLRYMSERINDIAIILANDDEL